MLSHIEQKLLFTLLCLSSVQFSRSVVSNSLRPHELQHARPPCPSPTPGVHLNSCPSSRWCHPAISSSVVPFSPSAPNPSQHQSLFQWVNSLQPQGPQHARTPCPSPTPRVYSNSCSLSQLCYPIISFLCRPLLLPSSIFPSFRVFSNESALGIRRQKYWSFSFSISPSNEYSGLISFRMDWLDLLAVQGTLKSLLQHHSYKA